MSALFRTPDAALPAPSGRMINALLQYADVQEDLGGGRSRMRLSKEGRRRPEVRAALGRDLDRAARMSVMVISSGTSNASMRTVSFRFRRVEYSTRSWASFSKRASCIGANDSIQAIVRNPVRAAELDATGGVPPG